MRKIVPMQPADVAAWTEIARIAEERLQGSDSWAPPTTPGMIRMKKPDVDIDSFVAPPSFFLEFLREFNRASSASIIPEECDVVSMMQNDGE